MIRIYPGLGSDQTDEEAYIQAMRFGTSGRLCFLNVPVLGLYCPCDMCQSVKLLEKAKEDVQSTEYLEAEIKRFQQNLQEAEVPIDREKNSKGQ